MQVLVVHHQGEDCRLRAYAERKPESLISRLWRWHTDWCRGWKSYQRLLQERQGGATSPDAKTVGPRMSS